MTRKYFYLLFGPVVLILLALIFHRPVPALGQTTIIHRLYFPLIYNPPEPPGWVGPYGGKIVSMAVSHSQPWVLYVGTWASGVFKSTDSGATWTWKSADLGNLYIQSIAVDPKNPSVAYAGTYKGKLYKTVNGGESWFLSSANIQAEAIVYSIVIDPKDTDNIYIGTRGVSNDGGPPWNGVLYRSTDAGSTWEAKLTDVGGKSQEDWAYSVTLHPQYPNQVYAATHEHGIYRSLNSGKSWEAVNDGITNFSTRAIVVNPNSSESRPVLYTGVWTYGGIFRSNNGGESWTAQPNGSVESQIYSMSINPVDSAIVYASTFTGGVLKTSNGGTNWSIVGLKDYEIAVTALDPNTPQVLYSGTNGYGLFKSWDAGANWQRSQKGLHAVKANAIQVSPENAQQLYAGLLFTGVEQSGDGGQTWSALGSGLSNTNVLGVLIPPDHPKVLFALTESSGLYRCDLQGTCWQKISITFPLTVQEAFGPEHPFWQQPFLEFEEQPTDPLAVTATPALLALKFAPSNPQIAYLGTSGAGVYKSANGGNSWSQAGLAGTKIVSLAVDAANPNRVFAASDTRVWSSDNGGTNWVDTGLSGLNIYTLALNQAGSLFAGTSNGVYQRAGAGWSPLGLAGLPVTVLAAHPTQAEKLYAGTVDGLRISRNGGLNWNAGPVELNGLTVNGLSFDPQDASYIFVSTTTQGGLRMQDWNY